MKEKTKYILLSAGLTTGAIVILIMYFIMILEACFNVFQFISFDLTLLLLFVGVILFAISLICGALWFSGPNSPK